MLLNTRAVRFPFFLAAVSIFPFLFLRRHDCVHVRRCALIFCVYRERDLRSMNASS